MLPGTTPGATKSTLTMNDIRFTEHHNHHS